MFVLQTAPTLSTVILVMAGFAEQGITKDSRYPQCLTREIETPVDRECVVEVILSLQSCHYQNKFLFRASAFPHRLYKNIRGHSEHLTSALIKKMIHWRLQVTIYFLAFCDANLENDCFFGPWASLTFSSSRREDHTYPFFWGLSSSSWGSCLWLQILAMNLFWGNSQQVALL
jgi:hypothetical protein